MSSSCSAGDRGSTAIVYVQVPELGDAGVLSTFVDALETFGMSSEQFPYPRSLCEMAATVEALIAAGTIVILAEFQYFNRSPLAELTSYLQAAVDRLSAQPNRQAGGLIVRGLSHTEMPSQFKSFASIKTGKPNKSLVFGYVLQAELWSQNPHILGSDFLPAVDILKNWLKQYLRDLGRQNREGQSVTDCHQLADDSRYMEPVRHPNAISEFVNPPLSMNRVVGHESTILVSPFPL